VPLRPPLTEDDGSNPQTLDLLLFPGADGRFTLYEDDNSTQNYLRGEFCATRIEQKQTADGLEITIHAPEGKLDLLPAERTYTLRLRGVKEVGKVTARVDGKEHKYLWAETELELAPFTTRSNKTVKVTLEQTG
jgi:alpha-glucosidase (family GH31 glycosyl hydrolase)